MFIPVVCLSQPPAGEPFVLGKIDHIRSAVLGEQRILNIYLPDNYGKDTAHYPVIYLLDGSANEDFIHITGLVQFLTMIQVMPPSIVVGIANVDRKRDFTFPTTIDSDKAHYPTTGGSAKFIEFLHKELVPYVSTTYRTNHSRTLIGQSLGGLLATEILFRDPLLFNNYIIVSPSLWWDHESLLKHFAPLPDKLRKSDNRIYVSVGSEGPEMENDASMLVHDLKSAGNDKLKISFVPLPEENHLTILHNSVYKAFEFLNTEQQTNRK